jgi:hypothetical protein
LLDLAHVLLRVSQQLSTLASQLLDLRSCGRVIGLLLIDLGIEFPDSVQRFG